jgi:hypothetical protein
MRFALLLLAVLGLLVGPGLAAAKPACGCPAQLAGHSPESGVTRMMMDKATADAAPMPCCDPASKPHRDHRSCPDMCSGMGLVALDVAGSSLAVSLAFTPATARRTLSDPAHPFEPGGLERPPKRLT